MISLEDSPVTRDGKALILAYDHGLEHGPSADFGSVPETLDPQKVFDIATHDAVTSLAVQKGVAETYYPSYDDSVNLLAKLNGTSNLWMGEPHSPQNWTVEYAAELGADAVGYTVYSGSNNEKEMYEDFRDVQEEAHSEYGLPVVMWSYPRGQGMKNDTKESVIAYATRIALEIGADMAKVKYPGSRESMEWAVQSGADMPVVMSGGSKVSDYEFLSSVEAVMDAGGAGLAVGRNVWQRDDPEAILDALEKVIFEGAAADEALDE